MYMNSTWLYLLLLRIPHEMDVSDDTKRGVNDLLG